jgi:hypothetical protein
MTIPACADDFSSVVKGIESHYGICRVHPHLVGFALFLAKPAMWSRDVSGLKVAVFEKENRAFTPSLQELDKIMIASLSPEWQPFVRVSSRREGEATVIYINLSGKHMGMLIATIERSEIAVVHLKVDGKAIERWMQDPINEAKDASML